MRQFDLQIGGVSPEELLKPPKEGFYITPESGVLVQSPAFIIFPEPRTITAVEVTVDELFNDNKSHELGQIYAQALTRDMDLCPAEVGPHYWRTRDQEWDGVSTRIAMYPITDSDGDPSVFFVERDADGTWLNYDWAYPTYRWYPDYRFLFRLRKSGA